MMEIAQGVILIVLLLWYYTLHGRVTRLEKQSAYTLREGVSLLARINALEADKREVESTHE